MSITVTINVLPHDMISRIKIEIYQSLCFRRYFQITFSIAMDVKQSDIYNELIKNESLKIMPLALISLVCDFIQISWTPFGLSVASTNSSLPEIEDYL